MSKLYVVWVDVFLVEFILFVVEYYFRDDVVWDLLFCEVYDFMIVLFMYFFYVLKKWIDGEKGVI